MADLYRRLPTEIQQAIFQLLVDDNKKKSLATALRVSKSWFAHGVPVLYRVLADLRGIFGALHSLNVDRYLSSICHIVFKRGCHRDDLAKIRDTSLSLPNLRLVSVKPPFVPVLEKKPNYEEEHSLEAISALLQPSVRAFSCIGGILTRDFLTSLKQKCPDLEKLELKFMGRHNVREIDEDYLRHWLRDMPSVHSVSIFNLGGSDNGHRDGLIDELVSDELVSDLLDRPLKTLGLERYPAKLGQLDESEIFYSLRDLRIVLGRGLFGSLPRFRYLHNLHVRIDGPVTETLLPSIASMVHLESLKIIFGDVPTLKIRDIMLLGNLHALKQLEIRSSRRGYGNSPRYFLPIKVATSFNKDRFGELVFLFPKMRHFFILFDWIPDSLRVLKSVAAAWPNIEYLGLGYSVDLHESLMYQHNLGVKKPTFPYLQKLMPLRRIVMDVSVELAESRR